MKRILCATLITALALALCAAPASAEAYTHPTAGFHLTIPDGWIAVDSANVDEVLASGRVSADMSTTITSIRGILDSTLCVFLFMEDAVSPPFVNVNAELKGEVEEAFTLDEMQATIQAYEAYYLEESEQFPGYTVAMPADAGQAEGGNPMGYLAGVYEKGGYQIALMQMFVGAGKQFYEFTLTSGVDDFAGAAETFGQLVESFQAP